jgi:hypothetical protein
MKRDEVKELLPPLLSAAKRHAADMQLRAKEENEVIAYGDDANDASYLIFEFAKGGSLASIHAKGKMAHVLFPMENAPANSIVESFEAAHELKDRLKSRRPDPRDLSLKSIEAEWVHPSGVIVYLIVRERIEEFKMVRGAAGDH